MSYARLDKLSGAFAAALAGLGVPEVYSGEAVKAWVVLRAGQEVGADTEVECYVMAMVDFDRLDQMHATPKTALLKNMLRTVTHTVRRLSQEVATLAQ